MILVRRPVDSNQLGHAEHMLLKDVLEVGKKGTQKAGPFAPCLRPPVWVEAALATASRPSLSLRFLTVPFAMACSWVLVSPGWPGRLLLVAA